MTVLALLADLAGPVIRPSCGDHALIEPGDITDFPRGPSPPARPPRPPARP
ncbi:hypothetical protein JNW91_29580 [Micromonospora sp. STR1_7]|uniref:Uncharacterized protein n=1 Tax=Micromonospora parastrephiae TaxID=2806101 RepID=A0ABS1Y215_9ACTN|nr:hypothetical protein [Micromonospora parastrephiae]MBM0235561.1 hypothetical protein [Micromonospora parastrephiae]